MKKFAVAFIACTAASALWAASPIYISPTTFDFGWCPDNAKVNAEFTIRNTGVDVIPIDSIQPTCGCTTSQFTPGNLASNQESNVILSFNTRGFAGSPFHKNAKIKTENGAGEYTVDMTGYVVNPNAPVAPTGEGIAAFDKGTSTKKQLIAVKNKSSKDVTLKIVQAPAEWAHVKLEAESLAAGASMNVAVTIDGSNDEDRTTSVTIEANDGSSASRFTIAVRSGTPPPAIRRPQAPAKPAATPAKK